jgi:hypothetical protein
MLHMKYVFDLLWEYIIFYWIMRLFAITVIFTLLRICFAIADYTHITTDTSMRYFVNYGISGITHHWDI